jgi:hypothetical protein
VRDRSIQQAIFGVAQFYGRPTVSAAQQRLARVERSSPPFRTEPLWQARHCRTSAGLICDAKIAAPVVVVSGAVRGACAHPQVPQGRRRNAGVDTRREDLERINMSAVRPIA